MIENINQEQGKKKEEKKTQQEEDGMNKFGRELVTNVAIEGVVRIRFPSGRSWSLVESSRCLFAAIFEGNSGRFQQEKWEVNGQETKWIKGLLF